MYMLMEFLNSSLQFTVCRNSHFLQPWLPWDVHRKIPPKFS